MVGGVTGGKAHAGDADAAPGGFGVLFVVDEAGSFLCGTNVQFRPVGSGSVPANARHAVAHFAVDGTAPPRSSRRLALAEGELLVAAGDSCLIGVLLSRPATASDASRAMATVLAFESSNAHHLSAEAPRDATWANAAAATLKSAWHAPTASLPGRPPSTPVYAHAVGRPVGASFMVRITLHNEGVLPARRVEVRFASPNEFLRPAAVYGEGAILGGSTLRLLDPLEHGVRALDVHFLPVEPRRGPLAITLAYTSEKGSVVHVPARRVAVAIDRPSLAAPLSPEADAIKSFLRRQDIARDGWRMYVRPHVSARFAYDRAKEAIKRDGLVKVFEFTSVHPAHFEVWYYGQVKGSDRPAFVEVSVHARSRVLELRAATPDGGELIGAVAEYRRRIRELLSERFMRGTGRVVLIDATPQRIEDAPPQLHAALLLRHLEGEITAQELEDELRRAVLREGDDALGLIEGYDRAQEAGGQAGEADAAGNGKSAEFELLPGLLDGWRPIVVRFASDESLDAPGPIARRRREYDRHSDMEIQDFDGEAWD